MNCDTCHDLLIEQLHGETEGDLRAAVSSHLGECGDCATAYCRLAADVGDIGPALVEAPSSGVRAALREKVRAEFAPPWWRSLPELWRRPIPAYGALVLALTPVAVWWVASTPRINERQPEPTHEASKDPRVDKYDATNTPALYRTVL